MNADIMFSSKSDNWATPQDFFDKLDAEFAFTLDPCASIDNRKCDKFYTVQDDGLSKDWCGERVFCNPPYGRGITDKWVKKCYLESKKPNTIVVCLLPARTDTKWFHDFVLGKSELRFVRGRLKFGGGSESAPFPSIVAVYRD